MCNMASNLMIRQLRSYSCTRLLSTSAFYNSRGNKMNNHFTKNSGFDKVVNPGIGRRLKILKEDTPDVETTTVIDNEDLEGLEGDFINAREMQDYQTRAAKRKKHQIELMMTERRFFKPAVEPNMLPWSEKKQIKLLHSEDPVKWNIDKLAESFPATPQIIKKIIKSSWKPESVDRIRSHDHMVVKNWEAFKEGKLEISNPMLKEHLKKFTKKFLLPHDSGDTESMKRELPKPQETEFSSIIQSYKLLNVVKKENSDALDSYDSVKRISPPSEQSSASPIQHQVNDLASYNTYHSTPLNVNQKSPFTLDELRNEMRKESAKIDLRNINERDRDVLKGKPSVSSVSTNQNTELVVKIPEDVGHKKSLQVNTSQRDSSMKLRFNDSDGIPMAATDIKRRIHIPKSKVKVGFLYKIKDCFYSHDGFFLYKVPGNITENS